jgi:hypothetical protein
VQAEYPLIERTLKSGKQITVPDRTKTPEITTTVVMDLTGSEALGEEMGARVPYVHNVTIPHRGGWEAFANVYNRAVCKAREEITQ